MVPVLIPFYSFPAFPFQSVDTQTIPPPRSQFGGNVMQWIIYDTYNEDFAEQQKIAASGGPRLSKVGAPSRSTKSAMEKKSAQAEMLNRKYLRCWQILERMINQNIFDDIGNDYRYWEDPADEFREGEGNLLPLWKFQYEKTKKMNVTEIVFNPAYYDLFAVCFGSRELSRVYTTGRRVYSFSIHRRLPEAAQRGLPLSLYRQESLVPGLHQ